MLHAPNTDVAAPWKQRFRLPYIWAAKIAAANPTRGLVISNHHAAALELQAWNVTTGVLRKLTNQNSVVEGWIAPDGRHVYYLADQGGNELGHLVRLPFEGGLTENLTPDLPPYTLRGVGFSLSGNLLALNPINADGFQLYCVPLDPAGAFGAPRRIYQSPQEAWGALLSADGAMAALQSTARAGGKRQYTLLALDTAGGALIAELWDGAGTSVEPVTFSPITGDPRILATSSQTGWLRPLVWNPQTGERVDLPGDLPGEIAPLDWSADGERVLLCQMHRGLQRLHIWNLAASTTQPLDHPDGTFHIPLVGIERTYFGPNDQILTLWEDSTHPPQVIALDARTGALADTLLASPAPPSRPWRSVTFASSDGQEVQGWLGVPDGAGPFPTILEMHGGPHTATSNGFSPASQAWLDHGFAFLTINYRGSTNFGRQFKEHIWGQIGHWEVEDMVAARTWLVEQGIAQADAVFLYGASYGGFLTLLGLGKRPELWAGGCTLVAIGDPAVNYADSSEALKGAMRAWYGGTPEERPDVYAAASPITYAEQVRAPVLVIQGRNDTRTTARQMELYEAKMKALGKTIEVDWFDAGHQVADVERLITFQERMLGFVYDVLRSQEKAVHG
jgi:dienelactone hydrolase